MCCRDSEPELTRTPVEAAKDIQSHHTWDRPRRFLLNMICRLVNIVLVGRVAIEAPWEEAPRAGIAEEPRDRCTTMNSLFSMMDPLCAHIMMIKKSKVVTANSSSNNGSSSASSSSSSGAQAVSLETTSKKVLEKKEVSFAPELDGLHCFETIIPSS
ncbi:unnamed protein product [Cochlearia groenlandica]